MTDTPKNNISRREMVNGALALGAVAYAPPAASATSMRNLSSYAAQKARELGSGRDVKLKILIPVGSEANISPVVEAFSKQSGIAAITETIALEDINTYLILRAFTDSAPYDVAVPATFGLPDIVDAGAVLPLSNYAATHEPEGLRSGILYGDGDSYDGEIYGFQTDGDTYLMFYNAALLNDPAEQDRYATETGHALAIPETWPELDRQLKFFHRPEEGLYGGSLFRTSGYLAWEWWVRFHAKGIWPFSPEMEPQIASDQGVEALAELIEASRYLVPEAATDGLFENWRRFGRGDVYCNIGWGGTQKYLNGPQSAIRGNLAFGPTPGGFVNGESLNVPYFNWGWNYVVSKTSREPEIAYLFSLFASSADISTLSIRAPDGFFDPFRIEHYSDQTIRQVYSDDFLKVHRESMQTSIPDLYLANQSEYFNSLNSWLDAALNDGVDPRQALQRAANEWKLITIRAGVDSQKTRWAQLREKYPSDVRRLLRHIE